VKALSGWWKCRWSMGAAILGLCVTAAALEAQSFPLTDTSAVVPENSKVEAVEYLGRKAVRVSAVDGQYGALAMLRGVDFQDGTIEADIALKVTTPPGVHMPGFVGIAFRAGDAGKDGARKYELFYLRPGNSHADDQAMRNHSVQYSSEPDFSWYVLRRNWPEVYESHAELGFERWIKVKIEVAGRSAKLYVNGEESPSLVVDGLKGEGLHGGVGLSGYAGEEAYFSNLRITPAPPKPVKNGSDVVGEWKIKLTTDYGPYEGTMKLGRDGAKVTGSWTGSFGANLPVTGIWRDGYVELSFDGMWTKEMQDGNPGPVTTKLAGWVDGDGAGGRARVIGRADGRWSAERISAKP
jgi:hypothetical protein